MKNSKFLLSILFAAGLMLAFTLPFDQPDAAADKINWMDWESVVKANEKEPRKIFVDVYTDWCGWCKRMDAGAFSDPQIVKYVNENFYAVKLDAEMKETINWRDNEFKYIPDAGRRGIHTLAYSLLEGKMSYPSIVYLNEEVNRIFISPGYKQSDALMKELKFAAEEHYKTTSWEEYSR